MDRKLSFSDLFADLLSEEENELFLRRLFSLTPGDWGSLEALCGGMPRILSRLNGLMLGALTAPVVAWLQDPFPHERDGYCLVVAYWEDELHCPVAVYNRAQLLRPQGRPSPDE